MRQTPPSRLTDSELRACMHTCLQTCSQNAATLTGPAREPGCPGEEAVAATILLQILAGETGCQSASDCNGRGTCGTDGVCACNPPYHGPDCSFKCDRDYCNNRGQCIGFDQCSCDNGLVWPPLCSVKKKDCTTHSQCPDGAYCALISNNPPRKMCWECTDCEGITCLQWGDSIDGSCSRCTAAAVAPAPAPRLPLMCGQTVNGTTVGARNQVGQPSGEALFEFNITQLSTVHFDSCNSNFDTLLRIMRQDLRSEVSECDDCGAFGSPSSVCLLESQIIIAATHELSY